MTETILVIIVIIVAAFAIFGSGKESEPRKLHHVARPRRRRRRKKKQCQDVGNHTVNDLGSGMVAFLVCIAITALLLIPNIGFWPSLLIGAAILGVVAVLGRAGGS